jgi:hypothetical protein
MRLHEEPLPTADPDDRDRFPTRGWKYLVRAMAILGILFLMSGIVLLSVVIGVGRDMDAVFRLLLFGWAAIPIFSGFLLLRASQQLASPARGSGTFLVVVAASTFVGLAWAAITAAIMLNPVVRE